MMKCHWLAHTVINATSRPQISNCTAWSKRNFEEMSIEKKDDELGTLYDILFDEEIICGLLLYTETKRCYRLTKQAFINISFGRTLQSGLTSRSSGRANNYEWKRNEDSGNNNDWRIPRTDNYNSHKGFLQNHKNNFNNNDNIQNTVSQFFSAYRQPSVKNVTTSHIGKQELNVVKDTTQIPLIPSQPKSVDAEFQAMWSQLQQKLPTSPPAPANPSPPTSVISSQVVSEQTNALKKFLKINGGELPSEPNPDASTSMAIVNPPGFVQCPHKGACCKELEKMSSRLGLVYQYCQKYDRNTEEIYGVLTFPDGVEFVGQKCKDRSKALDTAACVAVQQYPAILAKRSIPMPKNVGMKSGPPGMPVPAARSVPFPFTNRGGGRGQKYVVPSPQLLQNLVPQVRIAGPPPLIPSQSQLPNPPQQWCLQSSAGPAKSSLNPFVPLQAQTAAITKSMQQSRGKIPQQDQHRQPPPPADLTGQRLNSNVVRPVPQSPKKQTLEPSTSSVQQPKVRRGGIRIAAKFSTPLQK